MMLGSLPVNVEVLQPAETVFRDFVSVVAPNGMTVDPVEMRTIPVIVSTIELRVSILKPVIDCEFNLDQCK